MDLKKLDTVASSNEGFEFQLFDPGTLDQLGIYITVLGRDSSEYRRIASEQHRKRISKATRGGNFKLGAALSSAEMEADVIDLISACTKGWRDEGEKLDKQLLLEGAKLDCSKENAALIYARYPWIREQVETAVNDRSNFTKR